MGVQHDRGHPCRPPSKGAVKGQLTDLVASGLLGSLLIARLRTSARPRGLSGNRPPPSVQAGRPDSPTRRRYTLAQPVLHRARHRRPGLQRGLGESPGRTPRDTPPPTPVSPCRRARKPDQAAGPCLTRPARGAPIPALVPDKAEIRRPAPPPNRSEPYVRCPRGYSAPPRPHVPRASGPRLGTPWPMRLWWSTCPAPGLGPRKPIPLPPFATAKEGSRRPRSTRRSVASGR